MVIKIVSVSFCWVFQTTFLINVDKTFDGLWKEQPVPIRPDDHNATNIADIERWVRILIWFPKCELNINFVVVFFFVVHSWTAVAMWDLLIICYHPIVVIIRKRLSWAVRDAVKSFWIIFPIVMWLLIFLPWLLLWWR